MPWERCFVELAGVETGVLVVLPAVVANDFAACMTICGEVGWPCSDVGGVESVSDSGVVDGEGGSVPCWITVDDVSEPVLGLEVSRRAEWTWDDGYLGVAERPSGVELLHCQVFTTRLHCGVDQLAVFSVQGTEDLPDHLGLNRRQAII